MMYELTLAHTSPSRLFPEYTTEVVDWGNSVHIDKYQNLCHNVYGLKKHKNKHSYTYKHDKKHINWLRTHGRMVAATTAAGCCATGYIISLAFASPSSTPSGTPVGSAPSPTSQVVQSTPTPGTTPLITPTPGVTPLPAKATPKPTVIPVITPKPFVAGPNLFNASKKDIAMRLVSSAENSSLNWQAQYAYIEDIGDGRGYTGGIIGFCSGTGDMLELVTRYHALAPTATVTGYIAALTAVNGTASHAGLDPGFVPAWQAAAADPLFQQAQNALRDDWYFNPAVNMAIADGVHALGQFIYYDAMVMHGPGYDVAGFYTIRANALAKAASPAQGGDETTYLHAFLDARVAAMKLEVAHSDTSRVDTAQRVFLQQGNLNLDTPLQWSVYGDAYSL